MDEPLDNWPYLFRPQHQVVVATVIAHANSLPAVKAMGFLIEVVCGAMRDEPAVRANWPN